MRFACEAFSNETRERVQQMGSVNLTGQQNQHFVGNDQMNLAQKHLFLCWPCNEACCVGTVR